MVVHQTQCSALVKTDWALPPSLGHRHWVLSIAWSPDGKKLASGCKNGQVGGGLAKLGRVRGFLPGGMFRIWFWNVQGQLLGELLSFRFSYGTPAWGSRWAGPLPATASGSRG